MMLWIIDLLYPRQGVTRYMRSGSSGHDGRGWSPAPQHPYSRSVPQREVPERQAPERELPYGPEVSWPSGFPQMNFDTGEYHRLVDDYSHVDPQQGYADAGYGDAGYGDPGYADPHYDGQGQYTPGRQDSGPRPGASRHQEPPQYQEQQHQEPAYPVTGAQEIYRAPDSARYAEAPYSAEQVEPRHPEPRAVDPRLEGLRYDELRYDDPDLGEPGFSEPRYDEPLDDDAWYAELRRGGPAFPQAPTPSGPSRPGGPSRSESPYANGNPPSGASPRTNPSSGGGPANGGPTGGNGGRGPVAAYRSAPAGAREISGPREISGSRELGAPRDMGGSRENGGPREHAGLRRPGGSPRAALPQRPTVPGSGPQGPVPQGLAGPHGPVPQGPAGQQRPAIAQASSVAQAPVIARSPSIAQAPPGLRRPAAPQNFAGGPGTVARPEQAFLGAPPVSVLTPPTGNRMDSFAGPATQAWDAVADAPELESLEEYWQDDEGDVEYTALLEEFDVTVTSAPARSRPSMPRPSMPHPSVPRIGRRRGGSKDHRLWIGLGGVVIVAAAAIFGIVKFEFPSGGETHTLTTPATIDGCYARNPGLAKSMGLPALITKMTKTSGGTDPVSAAYEGPCGTTASSATQIVAVLEAHLANDSPAGGLRGFMQEYPNAKTVSAGPLGGEAGCTESNSISSSSSVALCSWFDDDSFGVIFSPTMSPTQLATAMLKIRSAVELKG
jgi:hypothetical protein